MEEQKRRNVSINKDIEAFISTSPVKRNNPGKNKGSLARSGSSRKVLGNAMTVSLKSEIKKKDEVKADANPRTKVNHSNTCM